MGLEGLYQDKGYTYHPYPGICHQVMESRMKQHCRACALLLAPIRFSGVCGAIGTPNTGTVSTAGSRKLQGVNRCSLLLSTGVGCGIDYIAQFELP